VKRWLPMPLLSLALLAAWLLLNQAATPGHVLLGGLLALALPVAAARMRPLRAVLRRPGTALRLSAHVAIDIVRANFFVARVVLASANPRSRFVRIALDLRDPHGLALLSCIITSTPGTVWVHLDDDRRVLLLHVLELGDEQALTDTIKLRYERPLMEIFE